MGGSIQRPAGCGGRFDFGFCPRGGRRRIRLSPFRARRIAGFAGLDGGLVAGALFVLLAQLAGLYRLPTLLAPGASLPRLTLMVALAQLAVVSALFLLKSGADHSRGATIAFAALALALTPLGRFALARTARLAIRPGVIQGCRIVTLGDPFELERLDDADFPYFGVEEVARVRLSGSAALGGGLLDSDRARVGQAIACARELRATEFAAVMPWGAEAALTELCALLAPRRCRCGSIPTSRFAASCAAVATRPRAALFGDAAARAARRRRARAKRAFDVVLAAWALVALAPGC